MQVGIGSHLFAKCDAMNPPAPATERARFAVVVAMLALYRISGPACGMHTGDRQSSAPVTQMRSLPAGQYGSKGYLASFELS